MSRPLRRYAPVLIASAAIVAMLLFWLLRGHSSRAPTKPTGQRTAEHNALSPDRRPHNLDEAPPLDGSGQRTDTELGAGSYDTHPVLNMQIKNDGDPKIDQGPDHPPPPPLTVDEKLDLARKHMTVMRQHSDQLKKEIAEDERAGRTQLATEKRVQLKRLDAQIELVKGQINAGVDPSRPEVEQQNSSTP